MRGISQWEMASRYGVGTRIKLRYTRAIINAIHSGELATADITPTPIFELQVPNECSGVPNEILNPSNQWPNKNEFASTLMHLAELYKANFKKYASGGGFVSQELANAILQAGPQGVYVNGSNCQTST